MFLFFIKPCLFTAIHVKLFIVFVYFTQNPHETIIKSRHMVRLDIHDSRFGIHRISLQSNEKQKVKIGSVILNSYKYLYIYILIFRTIFYSTIPDLYIYLRQSQGAVIGIRVFVYF